MKIDKIIFSSSELFSVYWNLGSKIWKTKFNIEPVCLLFGKKSNTDMNEDYGKVIEMEVMNNFPLLIQITWSKFYYTSLEPDTTWLIGDMDMYPLSIDWCTSNISDISDDYYIHLDADGITQLNGTKYTWSNKEINASNQKDLGHDTNLPAQYHCAKGKIFKESLDIEDSFENSIRNIVESGKYNGTRAFRESDPIEQHNLWCAEELRSTRSLRNNIFNGKTKFKGFFLRSGLDRIDGDHIHHSMYDTVSNKYKYDHNRLSSGLYKNIHCCRPFNNYLNESQCDHIWSATKDVLKIANMI